MPDVIDYGTDIACAGDVDPNFSLVSGPALVAQDMLHRFTTARGSLEWAPDDGLDLVAMVNDGIDDQRVFELQQQLADEASKDERVTQATADVSWGDATETLTVKLSGTLSTGQPFSFIFGVSKLEAYLAEVQ